MQAIRKLVTVAVAGVAALVGGVLMKPAPVPVQRYDHPAAYVVMHHQAGPAWTRPEQPAAWFKSQGYAAIAYNAIVTPAGAVWQGRGEQYASGANLGVNGRAVAFCFAGNLDRAPATRAAVQAAGLWLRGAFKRHPGAKLIEHGDVARLTRNPRVATGCPGKFAQELDTARAVFLVAGGLDVDRAIAQAAAAAAARRRAGR